jgi:hypothetical protein
MSSNTQLPAPILASVEGDVHLLEWTMNRYPDCLTDSDRFEQLQAWVFRLRPLSVIAPGYLDDTYQYDMESDVIRVRLFTEVLAPDTRCPSCDIHRLSISIGLLYGHTGVVEWALTRHRSINVNDLMTLSTLTGNLELLQRLVQREYIGKINVRHVDYVAAVASDKISILTYLNSISCGHTFGGLTLDELAPVAARLGYTEMLGHLIVLFYGNYGDDEWLYATYLAAAMGLNVGVFRTLSHYATIDVLSESRRDNIWDTITRRISLTVKDTTDQINVLEQLRLTQQH